MNCIEQAEQYFAEHYLCSQAVFAAFATQDGMTEEQALKVGACFGSGMCKGEVCGAVSGALMVIGLRYGQSRIEDIERRVRTNELTSRYLEQFQAQNGSYLCRELLGYDFSREGDAERAREAGVFSTVCPKLVESAARILKELLDEAEQNNGQMT